MGQPVKELPLGAHIEGHKDGNCLQEKSTGYYAPFNDKEGHRNFKNQRLLAMEKMTREEEGKHNHSKGGQAGHDNGVAHDPDMYVCVSDHDVPYRRAPREDAEPAGKDCKVGEKVHAILEGGWLRVLHAASHLDPAQALGRRASHGMTTTTLEETGLFLPLNANGQKLFKSLKLYLFEESAKPGSLPEGQPYRRTTSGREVDPVTADHDSDTWICTHEHGVKFYATDELTGQPVKSVPLGAYIDGFKDGNCLCEKSTSLYAPFSDKDGRRNFKSPKLLAMDKAMREGEDKSHQMNRSSFRWVDQRGQAQRVEASCDAIQDIAQRPEVWVCVDDQNVPFRKGPSEDAEATGKECKVGDKVNAVLDGEWLRVLHVASHLDAAQALGHRSSHGITKMTVEETGTYLPYGVNGKKLFKSYKLYMFEESAKTENDPPACTTKEDGKCSMM